MSRPCLHILAPGDPVPSGEDALVLVDARPIPAEEIDRLAQRIVPGGGIERAHGVYRLRESDPGPPRIPGHVLFFASDDTHVNTFLRIAPHCETYTFVVHFSLDLHARARLRSLGIPYRPHNPFLPEFRRADVALLGNDTGREERLFIHHCRRNGIPTVSLQEAVNMDFDGAAARMRWCDIVFVSGVHALRYLHRRVAFLTGNPRYDDLRPAPLPDRPYLLINCNFTFGVGVEWARLWLDDVIAAATALGLDYRVTRHPRDETPLHGIDHVLPSNAFVVHEHLAGCWALVSRDSSLPYEALLLDRHVVYYNPFREPERCLNEDDSGYIHKCLSPEALRVTLKRLHAQPLPGIGPALPSGLQALYTAADGEAHARVALALRAVIEGGANYRATDARREPYPVAWWRVISINIVRPRLRRILWLRRVYRRLRPGVAPSKGAAT